MNSNNIKRVALIAILVLPVLVYIGFVYGQKGVFFKTLEHVGPYALEQNEEGVDTVYYKVPEFELSDQNGEIFNTDSLEGNFYVMSFFFTSCPSICPAMNFHLKQISDRFKGFDDFYLISVTVDPENDTTETLMKYAQDLGVEDRRWKFLRGTQAYAHELAPKFFLAANEDSAAAGGYNHSSSVVIVDWNGNVRSRKDENGNVIGSYDVMTVTELNKLEEDIKVMKAEYESWKHYKLKR